VQPRGSSGERGGAGPGPWDPQCARVLHPCNAQTQPEDKKLDISYDKAPVLSSRNLDVKILLFGPNNGAAKCPRSRAPRDGGSALGWALPVRFAEEGACCAGRGPGTAPAQVSRAAMAGLLGTACQPGSSQPASSVCANRGVQGVTGTPAPLMTPGRPGAAPLSWPAPISSCPSPSLIEFSPLQLILMDFLVPPQGLIPPN